MQAFLGRGLALDDYPVDRAIKVAGLLVKNGIPMNQRDAQGKSIFDWLDQAKTPSRLAALRDALTTVATNPSAVTGTLTPPATEQVYQVGDGVSSPQVIIKQEPEYSTQACDQRIQGKVLLYLVVGTSGSPSEVRVLRSLEPSLDVRVMEAVRKWRFQPGKKDGIPVPVAAQVEVEFRLL